MNSDQVAADKELLDQLCDIEHGLTDWEVGFVDSVSRWVDDRPYLTVTQRQKAQEILARWEERYGDS